MKPISSTYSSDGVIPTSTYSSGDPCSPSFNLHGLTPDEAQCAIRQYAAEKEAARRRGIEQREICPKTEKLCAAGCAHPHYGMKVSGYCYEKVVSGDYVRRR